MSIQHDVSADQVSYSPLQTAELNAFFFFVLYTTQTLFRIFSVLLVQSFAFVALLHSEDFLLHTAGLHDVQD
jgi:hypothetical protein